MSFMGYRRANGAVGTRNGVGIISTVTCANDVSFWIAQQVAGSTPFLHGQGCAGTQPDLLQTTRTLISLGWNPNLAAILLVSLGCESVVVDEISQGIAASGKPVEKVVIQKVGGATRAVSLGVQTGQRLAADAAQINRVECPDSDLVLGIKCGASDTTQGLIANPVAGAVCDLLVDNGGTCIFGETTEFMGAEHILVRRASTPAVGQRILDIVARMEKRANNMGFDMRGGQPTTGNIAGGLTTIEEKSLGAISKGGSRPIRDVLEYGDRPEGKGLYIVDTPGREPEHLTALAAAQAQVVVFTTGLGAPQGFPFVPVIKVTGNLDTSKNLAEHIDLFVDPRGKSTAGIQSAGEILYREILAVASGKQTRAETLQYGLFPNIFTIGPVI